MEVTDIATYILIGAGISITVFGVPYIISLGARKVLSLME